MKLVRHCQRRGGTKGRCTTWPKCCDFCYRPAKLLPNGKRAPYKRLPGTSHLTEKQAMEYAQKVRFQSEQIANGLAPKPKAKADLLSVYIAKYTELPDVKRQKELAKLKRNLASFLVAVGDRPLDEVTGKMIDTWRAELLVQPSKMTGGTFSENTVQRYLNSVKGLFTYAVADDDLPDFDKHPCAKLDDWKVNPKPRREWRPDEQWLVDELPRRFSLPLKVSFHSTARRTEVLLLTRYDLSPKGYWDPAFGTSPKMGYIMVQREKKLTGQYRERIPVPLWLVSELWNEFKSPHQQHVFGDPPQTPGSWSSNLTREMRALGERFDIDTTGLCMHGIRHTAAGTMQEAPGVTIKTTQAMGGWSNVAMAARYTHMRDAGTMAASKKLATSWKPKRPKGLKAKTAAKVRRQSRRRGAA